MNKTELALIHNFLIDAGATYELSEGIIENEPVHVYRFNEYEILFDEDFVQILLFENDNILQCILRSESGNHEDFSIIIEEPLFSIENLTFLRLLRELEAQPATHKIIVKPYRLKKIKKINEIEECEEEVYLDDAHK